MILPKHIEIHKFTSPTKREDNAKPIEFWPVCDYWVRGQPNYGPAKYKAAIDPGDAGLCWIMHRRLDKSKVAHAVAGAMVG